MNAVENILIPFNSIAVTVHNLGKRFYLIWIRFVIVIGTLFFSVMPTLVYAEFITIPLKVKVLERTCDVFSQAGSNKLIEIDFENIVSPKVDGVAYEMTIPYRLSCSGSGSNDSALQLYFLGDTAIFNDKYLTTSETQLGLILKADNVVLPVGQKYEFYYSKVPVLTATPVIGNKGGLIGGTFTASTTLMINYQ